MKIIFWGTPEYAVPSLEEIVKAGHDVRAVITQPDRKRGRGNKLSYSPIKKKAIELNINVLTPINIKRDEVIKNKILEIESDIYIVVAFGQILPIDILEKPRLGCWNSHASLLPKYRGAAPIQWSLLNGDKVTGIGIMSMEETLDTGPIINEQEIKIDYNDNFESLSNKLSLLSATMLKESIKDIETTYNLSQSERLVKLNAKPQQCDQNLITYARQINKSDYHLSWNEDKEIINNKIRGLYPNVYTFFNGRRVKILEAECTTEYNMTKDPNINTDLLALKQSNQTELGKVVFIHETMGIYVACINGIIIIKSAQLEGKKATTSNILVKQLKLNINDFFI